MTDLDKLLNEISAEIQNEPCVKEYYRLKKVIKEDSQLNKLDSHIKKLQKEMCENRKDDNKFSSKKKEYDKLVIEFETNPIIINFKIVEEEVKNFLYEIKDVLEQK